MKVASRSDSAPRRVSHLRSARRWVFRVCQGGMVLVATLALAYGALLLAVRHRMHTSLPQTDGSLHLAGLSGPVTVERDGHGIPHIAAATLDDLLLAQGYVTAQDRLWQMDMARRTSAGTCAEVLGASCLQLDRTQRVLGFQQLARGMLQQASVADRHFLERYAQGVNAYIADHASSLPAEFLLLHYKPAPWTAADSLLVELAVAQMLDDHWQKLVHRSVVAARLGPALAADLYPNGSPRDILPGQLAPERNGDGTGPAVAERGWPAAMPAAATFSMSGLQTDSCTDCIAGSNAWVVAGTRTASGKPILSNDMHLGQQIPNLWYANELQAGAFHVEGVSMPGVPFIAAGRNSSIAWGMTAMYGATQSLTEEQVNGKGEYRHNGVWTPLQNTHETIHVRAGRDVSLEVQRTVTGPLLTPLLTDTHTPLALHWTLFQTVRSLPLFELNAATNWLDFRDALRHWPAPTLNLLYADRDGHIGFQSVGSFPAARVASTQASDTGTVMPPYVPFDRLPSVYDPSSGMIVTANARVTAGGFPFDLGDDWPPALREERIVQELARHGTKLTQANMAALQSDVYSALDMRLARAVATAVDHCEVRDAQQLQAARLLHAWNGVVDTSSSAAAIVASVKAVFWPVLLEAHLSGQQWKLYDAAAANTALDSILQERKRAWLPPGVSDWDHLLLRMLQRGLNEQHAPANLNTWQYGQRHVQEVKHPLYSMLPGMEQWSGPAARPQAGDLTTVKQVSRNFGPSQRFIVDWGDADQSTEAIVNGESGNPASPWYNDQWDGWYRGVPIAQSGHDALSHHQLRLLP